MSEEVVIDGMRYVPDPMHADSVKFYYMHESQMFTRLYGVTVNELLAHADEIEAESSYGMLCPATLLYGDKELRRVGPPAHSGSRTDTKDKWNAQKTKWREAIEADVCIMRLLPSNAKPTIPPTTAGATEG